MAVEAKNTLQSRAVFKIIDVISEGEIGGLVNGAKSILLNGTPIQNPDGSYNFPNIDVPNDIKENKGTATQDYLSGFPATESETSVSTKVTKDSPEGSGSGDGSVVKTISSSTVDSVRVNLRLAGLAFQNLTNGNLNGSTLNYQIEVQASGKSYVPIVSGQQWDVFTGTDTAGNATGLQASATITKTSGTVLWQYRKWNGSSYDAWVTFSTLYVPGGSTNNGNNVVNRSVTGLDSGQYQVQILANGVTPMTIVEKQEFAESSVEIEGKTTSPYDFSHIIELRTYGSAPYNIKVSRITADHTTSEYNDDLYWFSYTEIVDNKLTMPNTAHIGSRISADDFGGNIPSRAYEVFGRNTIKIPDTYDPINRTYSGTWTGTFNTGWTDNPAWIFYDLLTNKRYGLGNQIDESVIDKWTLYTIAQYCDEYVDAPDGLTEPRYSINACINSESEAYDLLNAVASAFRGMPLWSSGAITASADMPKDADALLVPSNVIDGKFSYSGSARKARHTAIMVSWNDPDSNYELAVEPVEDADGILEYGYLPLEINAYGCTSRGLAQRWGKWVLESEQNETEVVSYSTGFDQAFIIPGDIVKIQDPNYAQVQLSGRMKSYVDATKTIVLDRDVTLTLGTTYSIDVVLDDGSVANSDIVFSSTQTTDTLILDASLGGTPIVGAVWLVIASNLAPRQFRIISVEQPEKSTFKFTGLFYDPDKYARIETGLNFEQASYTAFPSGSLDAPTGLATDEYLYRSGSTIQAAVTLSWEKVDDPRVAFYNIMYKNSLGVWEKPEKSTVSTTTVDILNTDVDTYTFRVRAQDSLGSLVSGWTEHEVALLGKTAPPEDVTGFTATTEKYGILLEWNAVSDIDINYYEIRQGASWAAGTVIAQVNATSFKWEDATDGTYTFWIKARDTSENYSDTEATISETISVETVPTVTTISVTSGIQATITGVATTRFSHYEIQRRKSPSGTALTINSNVLTRIFTDSDISTLTYVSQWQYSARSIDKNGDASAWSDWSIAISAKQVENEDITSNQIISKDFRTACNVGSGTTGVMFNSTGLSAWSNTTNTFCIDAATGNVSMTGTITATAGVIGGWCIGSNLSSATAAGSIYLRPDVPTIYSLGCGGSNTYAMHGQMYWNGAYQNAFGYSVTNGSPLAAAMGYASLGTVTLPDSTVVACGCPFFWVGDTTNSMKFYGSALTIKGTICATAGLIGGFTIDPTEGLYAGTGATRVQMKAGAGFWAGATAQVDAPFSVSQAGALKAESGVIAGWDFGSTRICNETTTGYLFISSEYQSILTSHFSSNIKVSHGQIYDNSTWTNRYGLAVYSGTTRLFEASSSICQFAGWDFNATTLSSNNITINSAGSIGTTLFTTGNVGWCISCTGDAEFNNIKARGAIRTAVFIKDEISVIGGSTLIRPATTITFDNGLVATDTWLYSEDTSQFALNDIIRVKDEANDYWGLVYAIGTNATGDYIGVTRQSGDYGWTPTKGQAIVNYGSNAGCGGIFMDGQTPYIDIYTHNGTPWTYTCSRVRLGNLNGSHGFSTDTYGIAMGSPSSNYLRYDTASGLVKMKGAINIVRGSIGLSNLVNNFSTTLCNDNWTACSIGTATKNGCNVYAQLNISSGCSMVQSCTIDVDSSQAYKFSISLASSATGGSQYIGLYAFDATGNYVAVEQIDATTGASTGTSTTNAYWISNVSKTTSWIDYELYLLPQDHQAKDTPIGKNATIHWKMPANVVRVIVRYLNWNNAGTSRTQYAYSPSFTPVDISNQNSLYRGLNSSGTLIGKAQPTLVASPSGAGLYMGSDYMGFYNSGWKTYMDNSGRFYLSGTGTHGLSWTGATLAINGNITIQSGSTGYSNIDDRPTNLSGINSTEGTKLTGIATGADVTSANTSYDTARVNNVASTTVQTGASRAYVGLDTSNRLVTAVIPATAITPTGTGLYLGSNAMGFHNGSTWKTYMSNNGDFYLSGSTTDYGLSWDASCDLLTVKGTVCADCGKIGSWFICNNGDLHSDAAVSCFISMRASIPTIYATNGSSYSMHGKMYWNSAYQNAFGYSVSDASSALLAGMGVATGGTVTLPDSTVVASGYNFFWVGDTTHSMKFYNHKLTVIGEIDVASTLPISYPSDAASSWSIKGSTTTTAQLACGVIDTSGNAYHAYAATCTCIVDSRLGKAFCMARSDDTGVHSLARTYTWAAGFTVSAWVCTTNSTNTMSIMSKSKAALREFNFRVDNGKPYIWMTNAIYPLLSTTSIVGDWALITVTYDYSILKIYVNGIIDCQVSYSGAFSASDGQLTIGNWSEGGTYGFDGKIASPKLFERAITAEEVKTLHMMGTESESGTITAERVKSGSLQSLNWNGSTVGSCINMNDGTFNFGGGNLTWNGSTLDVKGTVCADCGNIGGWNINSSCIYSYTDATHWLRINCNGSISANFVTGTSGTGWCIGQDGSAEFNNVTVRGTVCADDGFVGGFTIDSTDGLYAGSNATRVQMKAGAGFWAGATLQSGAPFSVSAAGALKAESGLIAGWTINSTCLTSGNIEINSSGSISGNYTSGSAGWAINNDGSAEFNNVTVRGSLYSCVGTIGGWTLQSSCMCSSWASGFCISTSIMQNGQFPKIIMSSVDTSLGSHSRFSLQSYFCGNTSADAPLQICVYRSDSCYAMCTNGKIYVKSGVECLSDRNCKTDFSSYSVLPKLREIEIEAWKFKGSSECRIGVMAQDFYNIFKGFSSNDKSVPSMDGIALRGVQELDECNTKLETCINDMSVAIKTLGVKVQELQDRIN